MHIDILMLVRYLLPFCSCLFLLGRPQAADAQPIPEILYFSTVEALSPHEINSHYQDSQGYFWTATSGGLCRFDGTNVKVYESDPGDLNSLSTTGVLYLTESPDGRLWITTRTRGLNSFDPKHESFRHYFYNPTDTNTISSNNPRHIATDEDGTLWIGFPAGDGLNHFDPTRGKSRRFKVNPGREGQLQGSVTGNIVPHGSRIYLATTAGLEYYEKEQDRFHYLPLFDKQGDTVSFMLHALAVGRDGTIWTGLPGPGLQQYDPNTEITKTYPLPMPDSIDQPQLTAIAEDNSGRIWMIHNAELWSLSPDRQDLQRHRLFSLENKQPINQFINSLFVDRYGLLWVNDHFFDPRQLLFNHHQILSSGTNKPIFIEEAEALNDSTLLIRTYHGYFFYDLRQRRARKLTIEHSRPLWEAGLDPADPSWLIFRYGYSLIFHRSGGAFFSLEFEKDGKPFKFGVMHQVFDQDGDLWIATWGNGLIRIRRAVWETARGPVRDFDQWTRHSPNLTLPTDGLLWVSVDHLNNIWVSCSDGGLFKIDKASMQAQQYDFVQGTENTISATYIMQAFEGPTGHIWITTDNGGLNSLDPGSGIFTIYNQQNGLLNHKLFQAAFDAKGQLWFNTRSGISRLDPITERFTHYNPADGLLNWQHHLRYHAATDQLLLTGPEGFHTVSPEALKNRPISASPLRIVELLSFSPAEKDPLVHSPAEWQQQRLELPYHQNTLSLRFSLLDYRSPAKHEYQYALTRTGVPDWIHLGNRNQLNLTALRPGSYQFYLRGRNSDGIWTAWDKPLNLYIIPPWWRTTWAYLLYALLLAGGLYYFYRQSLRRQVALAEARQVKELDRLKSRFYTNITHEFRTPLTVILGMNEQTPGSKAKALIHRNADRLLSLVNQLLDLAKLDADGLQRHYKQVEVVTFVRYFSESFQSLALQKNVLLSTQDKGEPIWMDVDEQILQQILSNLLSNAIKFTPEGGEVGLQITRQGEQLLIRVRDTGIGISAEELPRIFDRFYQVDTPASREGTGTGIGLALTRELVALLDGSIEVDSRPGGGTTFELKLPIRHTALEKSTTFPTVSTDESHDEKEVSPEVPNSDLPCLLLIEDNADVVTYVRSVLQRTYHIQNVADGQAGIDWAIDHTPDIIISDVMMPRKNGYQVVETLKADERTDHIPIILLTAKATQQDKIEGLRFGADDYLTKPFNEQELLLRLNNLLELRRTLQKRYQQHYAITTDEAIAPEDPFMQKLRMLIENDLQNEWTIGTMAAHFHLSESQFYRKVKAFTGLSPNILLRRMRLKRAAEMLRNGEPRIATVAYAVGFSDPNFFSRQFSDHFGLSPSKYRTNTPGTSS